MRDLFERGFEEPKIVMNGRKVLKIDVGNIRFIDSLSFFQQPLSDLPNSFGFGDHVVKGFFPHLFNKEENYEYNDVIPDIDYFGIKYMKPKKAKDCEDWHKEERAKHRSDSTYKYNFKNELIKYCKNDVKILTMSIMKFRELFMKETELDPITRAFTLASVGLEYFQSKVLEENTIGITPVDSYVKRRNNSKKANIWLDWQQKCLNKTIKREHQYGQFWADGYIKEDKHVFEFFGCYFHGCPKCYPENRNEKLKQFNNQTYQELWSKTIEKVFRQYIFYLFNI